MKIKKKNTQTQTEEFRAEPITLLRYKSEEWPKVIRKPTLIYLFTLQEQPPDNKYPYKAIKY